MTANAIITEDSAVVTVKIDGKNVSVPLTEVTDLVVALLAARKNGYGQLRTARQTARAAKKADTAAKKAERETAKAARIAAKRTKLEAQLAALSA